MDLPRQRHPADPRQPHPDQPGHGSVAGSPSTPHEPGPLPGPGPRQGLILPTWKDLLFVVPAFLGFQPEPDSLVLIFPIDGAIDDVVYVRDQHPRHRQDAEQLWNTLGFATAPNASGAVAETVIIVGHLDYDSEPFLYHLAAAAPLPVTGLLRVHAGRWWHLGCPDPEVCTEPACGRAGAPYTVPAQVAAALRAAGIDTVPSLDDLRASMRAGTDPATAAVAGLLPIRPLPPRRALYNALAQARARYTTTTSTSTSANTGTGTEGGAHPDGTATAALDPPRAALLIQALAEPRVRDRCLLWTDDATWQLWQDLIRMTPPGWVAPIASVLAVTAFQRGNGMITEIACQQALAERPNSPLPRLLLQLLAHGAPPEPLTQLLTEIQRRLLPLDHDEDPPPPSQPRPPR